MLYMIIESFKNGDPVPVYRRFRDKGRQAPDALKYISSWVTTDMSRCYQLMECEDRRLLDDIEVILVILGSGRGADRPEPLARARCARTGPMCYDYRARRKGPSAPAFADVSPTRSAR